MTCELPLAIIDWAEEGGFPYSGDCSGHRTASLAAPVPSQLRLHPDRSRQCMLQRRLRRSHLKDTHIPDVALFSFDPSDIP